MSGYAERPGQPADNGGGEELPKRQRGASPLGAAGAKARQADPAGGDLPKRQPGASPLAAAGAKARQTRARQTRATETVALADTAPPVPVAAYTTGNPGGGGGPARRPGRGVAIAAAVALLAAGGVTFAFLSRSGGHAGYAEAASSAAPVRPPATAAPAHRNSPTSPAGQGHGSTASLEVAGVGCPADGGQTFTLDSAPIGPGWNRAGGGWTGNGCDGSTLWTMDPNGNQPIPSTLTWSFTLRPGASRCTLAVFIPTQNARGTSDYTVVNGPLATGHFLATFLVSQAAKAGQWFKLGTFPVSGSSLEITAIPVPGVSGLGHYGAIAASAASASCT